MKQNTKYNLLYESCRRYWNQFDPIGLGTHSGDNCPPDLQNGGEYDSYVPHTLTLVLAGADAVKLRRHIEHCCTVNMGLSPDISADTDGSLNRFIEQLLSLQHVNEH